MHSMAVALWLDEELAQGLAQALGVAWGEGLVWQSALMSEQSELESEQSELGSGQSELESEQSELESEQSEME